MTYTYTTTAVGKPNRVKSIAEHSGSTAGGTLTIEYAHNQTKFTDYSGNVQIVQFNNWGNTVSIQDDLGRAQYAQYAINDPTTESATVTAKGNQLRLASKLQNTVGNVLKDSSFENSTLWTATSTDVTWAIASGTAYRGSKSLALTRSAEGTAAGVYSPSFTAAAGATYTFSAYVKTGTGSAYLAMNDGSTTVTSETLAANSGWTRLEVSYTNSSTAAKTVTARLMTAKAGTTYLDCVQVEKAPTASRYNLVENGDFRYADYAWSSSAGRTTVSAAAAPELDTNVYKIAGDPAATNRISQTVYVSGSAGDAFVLAGWAKGDSVPLNNDTRQIALTATFNNTDGTTSTRTVQFNPCADSTIHWQYAAGAIAADKAYSSITVKIAYDYNMNTVYFDGIQLYKEEFGSTYSYDANGNVTKVEDVLGQTTTYTYSNNNLTGVNLPTGGSNTYTYDSYHNVKTATTPAGVVYTFTYDAYGNNTAVSISKDGTTVTSSAAYTTDGNRLDHTVDAAGNVTTYSYNANTNVLEWVQYPEDTADTRTEYTYDDMYRLASASVDVSTGSTLSATYGYTDDLLTSIQTGSTTYSFTYGAFALRSNIKIGDRTLATYTYTSRTNYLASLDYGNGDSVDYTYDKQGRVTKELSEDGDYITYKYDNDGALAYSYDSKNHLHTTYNYDFAGRLVKTTRKIFHLDYVQTIRNYNEHDQLTKQVWKMCGNTFTQAYAYNTDGTLNTVSTPTGQTLTMNYDALGRRTSVTGCSTARTYAYRVMADGKITSQLESLSYPDLNVPLTWVYSYDDNGNISAISDPTQGNRSYTYDSQGQLLSETIGDVTYTRTYDDAGNILTSSDGTTTHTYTYGNSEWGDLLTAYDGETITYDEIGNPTSYYNGTRWTLTWEHGRELITMKDGTDTLAFIYDENNTRIFKYVNDDVYSYYYDGDKLIRMDGPDYTMYFFYDADGRPYSCNYNGLQLYYVLNAQGDVVKLVDGTGESYGVYRYDAWGNIIYQSSHAWMVANPLRYRGYVYDEETQLYYCQSRYYDPAIGRFINADGFVSTGQGILGNNMFAYCRNNPVNYADPSGNYSLRNQIEQDDVEGMMGSAAVTAALVVAGVCLLDLIAKNTAQVLTSAQREVYEFAQILKDFAASMFANHQPRVHHIVPWGRFSNRSTSGIVRRMQDILTGVGIDPRTDPLNQIVISHGHHKSIHTNGYLLGLYAALELAEGDRNAVETALFFARIYIAFTDPFSINY